MRNVSRLQVLFILLFIAAISLPTFLPKLSPRIQTLFSRNVNQSATDDRLSIDKEKTLDILKDLQFPEKELIINKAQAPADDYGFLIKNDEGRVLIGSRLISDDERITWDIFVSDEYLDKNGDYEVEIARDLKERALTEFALRSFIMSSQEPKRELEVLYPVANRPILFTINY